MTNKPTDMTGVVLHPGALAAMATLCGRSASLEFRVIAQVTEEGRVQVRGVGGPDRPLTKPSFISYPERLVQIAPRWADFCEGHIVAAAQKLVAGTGMAAFGVVEALDIEEFIRSLSSASSDLIEPWLIPGAVEAILHNEASFEWKKGYLSAR